MSPHENQALSLIKIIIIYIYIYIYIYNSGPLYTLRGTTSAQSYEPTRFRLFRPNPSVSCAPGSCASLEAEKPFRALISWLQVAQGIFHLLDSLYALFFFRFYDLVSRI